MPAMSPIATTRATPVAFADGVNLDAFGRLRVSQPANLFDSKLTYNLAPLSWQTITTGSGAVAHLPAEAAARMRVTGNGDSVIRQTFGYFPYRPGKSQLILLTGVMGIATGVTNRVGSFDAGNGLFFQTVGTALSVVRRTNTSGSPVDEVVPQANWNIDPLDGTGPSGITIDPSKAQIWAIDYEWLGVGRVRMAVVVAGQVVPVHQFLHSNVITSVYMRDATLPLRYEISASGTTGTVDAKQICASVTSEGGEPTTSGQVHSASNGTTLVSASTRRAILSIRPAATFNSIVNRHWIVPAAAEVYCDGTVDALIEVVRGGALGGSPSWGAVSANSAVEVDTAGTTVTGGETIYRGYAVGGGNNIASGKALDFRSLGITDQTLILALDHAGANPIGLSIVATGIGGTASVAGALTWTEVR